VGDLEVLRGELIRREQPRMAMLARQAAIELLDRGVTHLTVIEPVGFAQARVNYGEWIADCPAKCGNAEYVTGKDPRHRGVAGTRGARYQAFVCTHCGYRCPIYWPPNYEDITEVLDQRPLPGNRNWWPIGHPQAVICGVPTGQSVRELLAENVEHGVA